MGRTLKRVALDFDWPLNTTWEGFLNPHRHEDCPDCEGSGFAPDAKRFADEWYGNAPFDAKAYGAKPLTVNHPGIQAFAKRNVDHSPDHYGSGDRAVQREARRLWEMWHRQWSHNLIQADVDALVADERLWDFTRVPLNDEQREIVKKKIEDGGNSWLPENNGRIPTADEVNSWSLNGMGHDSINRMVCVEARCVREGVPYKCAACDGSGEYWESPALKKANEEWKESEPPAGPGYQLWETTSEGSPISPVFSTLDDLCRYAAIHCTTFGSHKVSADEWRKMLDDGFVKHVEGNMMFL